MTGPGHVAVIDIGKTNAKLALVDMANLTEVAVVTRPNTVLGPSPWPHFDLDGHWDFILAGLRRQHRAHGVDAIAVTTHGASIVLLDDKGALAAPMLDYEHDGPDRIARAYDALRPDFAETGSPRLPMGLNAGAQLHWLLRQEGDLADRTAHILTYPQYWGFRLTGEMATDVTSLGCHTDLWNPYEGRPSSLCDRLGITGKLAPARRPDAVLGRIRPDIARATGLPAATEVAVGIHDSNASLYVHLLRERPPFSVVSTGTWVVAMAVGGASVRLDPARDTLVNVNAFGQPVPSARFMGGREYERVRSGLDAVPGSQDFETVLEGGSALLPSVVAESGPFPGQRSRWIAEPAENGTVRDAALSYYLGLMSAVCLGQVGHRGAVLVEGPFARNTGFLDMLSVATASPVMTSASVTGTSLGASLLMNPSAAMGAPAPTTHTLSQPSDRLRAYADRWMAAVTTTGQR